MKDREKIAEKVALLVAEHLPKEFIHEAVTEAIKDYVTKYKPDSYTIEKLLAEEVVAKTRELLRTVYADKIDALAHQAAQQVLAARPR